MIIILHMLTYKQIQELYLQRYNNTIQTCWIADVKRSMGMSIRPVYIDNMTKPCPSKEIRLRIKGIIESA